MSVTVSPYAPTVLECDQIDLQTETVILVSKVPDHLPAGVKIGTAAAWRWANKGVRGIKLASVAIGGKRFTSVEAVARFLERQTRASTGETINVRTNRQRERANQAVAALAAQGM